MANEHFFPGDYFTSGLAAPFLGSSYAPPPEPGLDVAAAMSVLGLPWSDHQLPAADSSATTAHFDSALSSLVSSPAAAGVGDEDVAIGDLIGRLGSICNGASANNSCYSTPLSSPPRGAPQTAFRGYAGASLESGRLSRVSSSKSLGGAAPVATALENSGPEMSSKMAGNPAMPDRPAKGANAGGEGSARKRKPSAKGKAKETSSSVPVTAATNASPKRSKVAAASAAEEEKPEPPKDYIHVRARRGQATDSHSIAERVRRERISERMKMLQSLVPGCNKITGKALMLDEIINYVQSLQRQVEFLSMKLATMSPQLDFDGHYLPSRDMNQMAMPAYPSDDPASAFSYTGSHADPFAIAAAHHGLELEACNSFQPGGGAFSWEQDLQSMVHMGAASHGQDQKAAAPALPLPHPRGFYGQATVNHTKVEP